MTVFRPSNAQMCDVSFTIPLLVLMPLAATVVQWTGEDNVLTRVTCLITDELVVMMPGKESGQKSSTAAEKLPLSAHFSNRN